MQKKDHSMKKEASHLYQETEKELVMLRPHRQHQFHCDEVHRIMDANAWQNNVSLHVPPYFQNTQRD